MMTSRKTITIHDRVKRVFDILVASTLGLMFAPFMLLAAIAIKLTSSGPVFFVQERFGKDGVVFRFIKFRTMYISDSGPEKARAEQLAGSGILYKNPRDHRITRVGRILRRASLDELPQLYNVISGSMSMVGPRPLVCFMVEQSTVDGRERFSVKPGISGYWQIYARDKNTSLIDMLPYDLRYVNERSIWTDIKILALTVPAVLSGRGAY